MLDPEFIRRALSRFPLQTSEVGNLRPSAVLLPLFVRDDEPHLLFTRRSDEVKHHQGEISFPGGAWELEDSDLLATALREAEEEVGLQREDVTVLGRLDDFESIHGYHVIPYVGHFSYPYPFNANPGEIAEMIEVPVCRLRDPAIFRVEDWTHKGRKIPVCFYTVDGHEIWGLTASILRQFLDFTG